jgi:hypothetical protein
MGWRDRIAADLRILVGKPGVKWIRIAVELVIDLLARALDLEQIRDSYPGVFGEEHDENAGRDRLACCAGLQVAGLSMDAGGGDV